MVLDQEMLSPPEVQPAPLAAAIPGALRVLTVAKASTPLLEDDPLSRRLDSIVGGSAVSNQQTFSTEVYRWMRFDYKPLGASRATNLEDELIYELDFLVDDWMSPAD